MIGSEICYDAGRNDKKHRIRLSEFTPMARLQREFDGMVKKYGLIDPTEYIYQHQLVKA